MSSKFYTNNASARCAETNVHHKCFPKLLQRTGDPFNLSADFLDDLGLQPSDEFESIAE